MVFEECPFCDRYVEVKLVSIEPEESGGYKHMCTYCKKTWVNSSFKKIGKKKKKKK